MECCPFDFSQPFKNVEMNQMPWFTNTGSLGRLARRRAGNPGAVRVLRPFQHAGVHWAGGGPQGDPCPGCVILICVCPLGSLVLPEICGWHKVLGVRKEHHIWPSSSSEDQKNYPEGCYRRGLVEIPVLVAPAAITHSHEWLVSVLEDRVGDQGVRRLGAEAEGESAL